MLLRKYIVTPSERFKGNILSFKELPPPLAPHPKRHGELILLSIGGERVRETASLGRYNSLFELDYNICGVPPDVNNIGYHEREDNFPDSWGGLKHCHVIFKGIKRPFQEKGLDGSVYVYVASPRYVYKYEPHMVCVAKRIKAPLNAVFATYVKFDHNLDNGEVISWEWVVADKEQPQYPENYANRYDEKVWENG